MARVRKRSSSHGRAVVDGIDSTSGESWSFSLRASGRAAPARRDPIRERGGAPDTTPRPMTPVSNATRRQVISPFRFHSGRSPAESSAQLTAFAGERGLSSPRRPPPGSALEEGATAAKAPLWAVQAAAVWLHANAILTDPGERAAVLGQNGGGGERERAGGHG